MKLTIDMKRGDKKGCNFKTGGVRMRRLEDRVWHQINGEDESSSGAFMEPSPTLTVMSYNILAQSLMEVLPRERERERAPLLMQHRLTLHRPSQ